MMTPWITGAWTVAIAATLCICVLHAAVCAHTTNRRYRLAWTDPDALAIAASSNLALRLATISLAILAVIAVALLLVPISPLWRPEPLAGPMIALLGLAGGGVVFRGLARIWCPLHALLAAALVTTGTCGLTRVPLWSSTSRLAHLQALVVALALMAALWSWMCGVWLQQLDRNQAWTVAGRLIPWSRWFAAGNGLAGVLTAWSCALAARSATQGGIVVSIGVHVLLIASLAVALRRWWSLIFMLLVLSALASMLVLISGPVLS